MDPYGVSWNADLQRYERQRRTDPGPVADPNPRTGVMVDLDPHRGRFGAPNKDVTQAQAAGAQVPGRHTLRNEWNDPDLHKRDVEKERVANARTQLGMVPSGVGHYTGGLRAPPVGANNRLGREHLFDRVQHVTSAGNRTLGLNPATGGNGNTVSLDPAARNHPDEWFGNKNYNPNTPRGRFDEAGRSDAGRKDLFSIIAPDGRQRDPDDKMEDNWVGHLSIKPREGKGKASEGMYVENMHKGRRDLFAVVSGRPPEWDDHSGDGWLGNELHDPARAKFRPDRVEDELGVGLTKTKTSTKEWGTPLRVKQLEGPGQLDPLIRPDLYPNEDFSDPDLNRGPKKTAPPPHPSGRKDFYPVLNQDPNLKDDFGVRRKKYVQVPGSDTDPGKGSYLMYSNEYCSTLNRRGVM